MDELAARRTSGVLRPPNGPTREVLTGSTGNAPFSRSSAGILRRLLRSGQVGAVARQLSHRRSKDGILPATRMIAGAAAPLWVHRWRSARRQHSDDLHTFASMMPVNAELLSPEARAELSSIDDPASASGHPSWVDFVLRDASLMHVDQAVSHRVWWSDPLSDPEVVALALSLPDESWIHDGRDRSLARRAASGLVPDAIRLRTTRGEQAVDVGLWIKGREREYLEAIDRVSECAVAQEVMDVEAIRRSISGGMPAPGLESANWGGTYGRALNFGLYAAWWEDERRSLLRS